MDTKRTLWIVGAVGLFLLVVVGFALIIYSPAKNSKNINVANQSTNDIWASTQDENLNTSKFEKNETLVNGELPSDRIAMGDNQNPVQGPLPMPNGMPNGNYGSNGMQTGYGQPYQNQPPAPYGQNPNASNGYQYGQPYANGQQHPSNQDYAKVKDLTVYSDNTKIVSNKNSVIDLTGLGQQNGNSRPVINNNVSVNPGNPAPYPYNNGYNAPQYAERKAPEARPQPMPAQPAQTGNTSKANSPAQTSTASKPAPKPQAAPAKPAPKSQPAASKSAPASRYWIQVSSYSNKKYAEEARNSLTNEKIPAEIFTFTDKNGNLFYRVRVGPYTTKNEAQYWQTRISAIDKFSNAKTYITDSSAKK